MSTEPERRGGERVDSEAEATAPSCPHVELVLNDAATLVADDDDGETIPPPAFFDRVRTAYVLWLELHRGDASTAVAVTTPSRRTRHMAKVLLIELGVPPRRVLATAAAGSARRAMVDATTRVRALPDPPPTPYTLRGESVHAAAVGEVLIVLGNLPFDSDEPTLDTVWRARAAASFYRAEEARRAGVVRAMVLTGGVHPHIMHAPLVSEAMSLALLLVAEGVPRHLLVLESHAKTTVDNAVLSAPIIRATLDGVDGDVRVLLVSRPDHLDWAVPIFHRKDELYTRTLVPMAVDVPRALIVADYEARIARAPGDTISPKRLAAFLTRQPAP